MSPFIISGFADEIDEKLDVQMDLLDTLPVKYIEARGIDGKNISKITTDEAIIIKKRLDDRGFKVSALGSPIGKIKITDAFDDELALFSHVLELAKIFETEYIRIFSFYMEDGTQDTHRDECLRRMSLYAKTAKGHGVTLLHENEKGIYGDTPERCVDIFRSVDSDILKATFDPANFIQCGVDVLSAFDMLLPYIEYMHIKDAVADGKVVPAGYGLGNFETILKKLRDNGFHGFLSLEPHLSAFSGFSDLEEGDVKLEVGDNKEKFVLAYNSLKKIIDNI